MVMALSGLALFTKDTSNAQIAKLTAPPAEFCDIKGNIEADNRRLFYFTSDPGYQEVAIDQDGEGWFCEQEQAETAGFMASNPET